MPGPLIPEKFAVDFTPYRKDLIQQAINRLLGQHYTRCTIKQFVLALMGEVQCLYDAMIDVQEMRTLYKAEGENLDAIGRIVGEDHAPPIYDTAYWMCADRPMQRPDYAPTWCLYGTQSMTVSSDAQTYKLRVLARIAKNHTLAASVPELVRLIHMITDRYVSFEKTGPMQVSILVPPDLSPEAYRLLTHTRSDKRCDDAFMLPYPATLFFYSVLVFFPERPENLNWFCADRPNLQRGDRAPCAVGIPFTPGEDDTNGVEQTPDPGGPATIYLPDNWLCADRTTKQRPDNAQCATSVPYTHGG